MASPATGPRVIGSAPRRRSSKGRQPDTLRGMNGLEDSADRGGLRARSEEAVGELAQALLENPLFSAALGRALGAGERAASAQRSAIGALSLASASDVERLEQRLRSLSGRVEDLEDRLDDLGLELAALSRRVAETGAAGEDRVASDP
jgi:hypothetical protein